MVLLHLAISAALFPVTVFSALHTSGRWILDSDDHRFKLKCVSWASHMEFRIPEGLQHQTADVISSWVASGGFNCVRLTYSVDMALDPDQKVTEAIQNVAMEGFNKTGVEELGDKIMRKNPHLAHATVLETFVEIIESLGRYGLLVILDNHVSKASWCCDYKDGNGWFGHNVDTQYKLQNSRHFDTEKWLRSLRDMATLSTKHPNIVGMSLRNELRALGDQANDGSWYEYVTAGAQTIHSANPDLLIMIGGTRSAGDLSFLRHKPLETSLFPNRTVWEFHTYPWSYLFLETFCPLVNTLLGHFVGFVLQQNQPYTGPLFLSEFGVDQGSRSRNGLNWGDAGYMKCLIQYMSGNDADWALWPLQGSYYVRDSKLEVDETYGMLNLNWTDWRNPEFFDLLGPMWNTAQSP